MGSSTLLRKLIVARIVNFPLQFTDAEDSLPMLTSATGFSLLSQINPWRTVTSSFCKIDFNIFPTTLWCHSTQKSILNNFSLFELLNTPRLFVWNVESLFPNSEDRTLAPRLTVGVFVSVGMNTCAFLITFKQIDGFYMKPKYATRPLYKSLNPVIRNVNVNARELLRWE
jgi:hypothetical protein